MALTSRVRARALLTVLLASGGGCSEVVGASYATYADAERAGAVARGWLPSFMPRSATDIREVHDLDTNAQWLRFRVPAGDTSVATGAAPLPMIEARRSARKPPSAIGRWLPELRDPPLVTPRASVRAYRHLGPGPGARCIALDTRQNEAYAWSC
jgi:hypothetical protein